jgi:crossover junction endodeoxyribonuclease RuvC
VLGVDPGTTVTGWGVIERRGSALAYVAHGTVSNDARVPLARKLAVIHEALAERCAEWRPMVLALEKSFVGRNVQSAFRLGEVRGVAMLVAAARGLEVAEYSPAEVKLAVTGTGGAEKRQVQRAVARELGLTEPLVADAADALAVALCHLQSERMRGVLARASRVAT